MLAASTASLPNVPHWAGEWALRAPFEPPASRAPAGLAAQRRALPPLLPEGAPMTDRRTAVVRARVLPSEHTAWLAKAAAAGVSPSSASAPGRSPASATT